MVNYLVFIKKFMKISPDEMEDNEVEMLFSSMGKYFSTLKRLKLEFLE